MNNTRSDTAERLARGDLERLEIAQARLKTAEAERDKYRDALGTCDNELNRLTGEMQAELMSVVAERNQLLAEVNKAQDERDELEATAARYWSIIGVYAAALESISENSNDPEAASIARDALNGGTDD